MRALPWFALAGLCFVALPLRSARAEPAVLIAASDPAQIAGVEVAKVMAADSSLWLRVTLAGHGKVALVTAAASVEPGNAADAWLGALDFTTRVRVVPPSGPPAACAPGTGTLADSGLPEPPFLAPLAASDAASELELRRALASADLSIDLTRLAEFTAQVRPPFRVTSYEASDGGGSTEAVRLRDSGAAFAVPGVATSGRDALPFTLLALGTTAVLPATTSVSEPTEFPVRYLAANGSTDYVAARGAWLAEDPTRWLLEARGSSALFAWTLIPGAGEIEPALVRYFAAAAGEREGRACFSAALAARARASRLAADFDCAGADDLARSSSELDFGEIRLTRLFGSIGLAGVALRASDAPEQGPEVVATDVDTKDCPAAVLVSPSTGGATVPGSAGSSSSGSNTGTTVTESTDSSTTMADGDSCTIVVFNDSCSGDTSSSDGSSNDSCSGDTSPSDGSSNDSCSGDSSSSDGSDDTSGCGKSNYDGDTCSGNSSSAAARTSAALEPSPNARRKHRPRQVRLSLLTLLSAALALPVRRWKFRRAPSSA